MALQTMENIGSTSSSQWGYKQIVTENSIDEGNNTSSITVETFITRNYSQSYLGGIYSGYVTIGDISRSFSGSIPYPTYINVGEWYSLGSVTVSVPHNSDGTKTININSSMASGDFTPSSGSAGGTMTLTPINVGTIELYISGNWKKATPYIRIGGAWKKAQAYLRVAGSWKKGR